MDYLNVIVGCFFFIYIILISKGRKEIFLSLSNKIKKIYQTLLLTKTFCKNVLIFYVNKVTLMIYSGSTSTNFIFHLYSVFLVKRLIYSKFHFLCSQKNSVIKGILPNSFSKNLISLSKNTTN